MNLTPGPAAFDRTFRTTRATQRAAFTAYYPVGFPTFEQSIVNPPARGCLSTCRRLRARSVNAPGTAHETTQTGDAEASGQVGKHTDGVLDGPVIQQAAHTALAAGFRMRDVFDSARELATSSSAALLVMTYWQPLHVYGPQRFATEAAAAGIDGILVPDLPLEEAAPWQAAARTAGIGTIPLVSPRTRPDRLARIVTAATGMVYAPTTDGLTGNSQPVSPRLPGLITQIRSLTSLPVAAGIGISTPAQARTAAAWADVVVVGSALIRRMQASPRAQIAAAAAAGRDFAAALRPNTGLPEDDEDRS